MIAKTHAEIKKAYDSIDGIKRLSDRIIGIGPINLIGLDGILAFIPIPGLSLVYSIGASSVILYQAIRAKASLNIISTSFMILLLDSGLATVEDIAKIVPGFGTVVSLFPATMDVFFQGHLYAAHLVQKEINQTLYLEESESQARKSGRFRDHLAQVKSTKGKKRVVYLLA